MSDNKKSKSIERNHAKKSKKEQTELDKNEKTQNQEHRKPKRFQFGHDTTDEDIEKFPDMVLGPDTPRKMTWKINRKLILIVR